VRGIAGRWIGGGKHDDDKKGVPDSADPKTGRNEPCPCGSGKKRKRCCGGTHSPLNVAYAVRASNQSVQVSCQSSRIRWKDFSNPPFRTSFFSHLEAFHIRYIRLKRSAYFLYPRLVECRLGVRLRLLADTVVWSLYPSAL
jgi:hypothetical protein